MVLQLRVEGRYSLDSSRYYDQMSSTFVSGFQWFSDILHHFVLTILQLGSLNSPWIWISNKIDEYI